MSAFDNQPPKPYTSYTFGTTTPQEGTSTAAGSSAPNTTTSAVPFAGARPTSTFAANGTQTTSAAPLTSNISGPVFKTSPHPKPVIPPPPPRPAWTPSSTQPTQTQPTAPQPPQQVTSSFQTASATPSSTQAAPSSFAARPASAFATTPTSQTQPAFVSPQTAAAQSAGAPTSGIAPTQSLFTPRPTTSTAPVGTTAPAAIPTTAATPSPFAQQTPSRFTSSAPSGTPTLATQPAAATPSAFGNTQPLPPRPPFTPAQPAAAAPYTTAVPTIAPLPPSIAPIMGGTQRELPSALFQQVSDYIYEVSGIRFQEAKSYFLTSKLNIRCDALGIGTFADYLAYIKKPEAKVTEHPLLLNEITVNETFFYRNQPQLDLVEKHFLPQMFAKKRQAHNLRFRIWSCAASTGDESYTMALQLLGMPEARDFRFEIVGTDICRSAIEQARKGEYKNYAIRNIPQDLLRKYFTVSADGQTYTISEDLKRMVNFYEANLTDASRIGSFGKFDLAICRNVLIYFDDASKEKVLQNIYTNLNDDGLLIAGHSENLYSHRHLFKSIKEPSQAHAYEKAPLGTPKV